MNHARSRSSGLTASLTLLLAIVAVGCHEQRLAQQRVQKRIDGVRATLAAYREKEASSPLRLQKAAISVRQHAEEDARQTRANFAEIRDYLERDLRHWRDSQPLYRKEASRILWAEPETIERTAVVLFL